MTIKITIASLLLPLFAPAAEDRLEDRQAIRADIDAIYKAYIDKDRAKVRETHDTNWHGFLPGSRQMIRNADQYMDQVGAMTSPYGMTAYKIRDFDILFSGDAAFVTFITDVETKTPAGPAHTVQRLADFYVKKNGKWVQSGSNTSISPETIADQMQQPQPLSEELRSSLLSARDAVWKAYFSSDRAALEKLIPEELVTIGPGGSQFGNRSSILAGSAAVAQSGAKLTRLEFPKTEIQMYGNAAFVYSSYSYDLENNGERKTFSGRATEVFVIRKGHWVNPGWHLDNAK